MNERWHAALAALVLAACSGGGRAPPPGGQPEVDARSLCVSSDCGEAIVLLPIPDAENIHFTPEGRLFVTGGSNVYEITQQGELDYSATPLSAGGCNFTGMAQRDQVLYVSCGDGSLHSVALDVEPAVAEPIFQMAGMCIANGTALGPDGRLYIVDEPLDPSCLPPEPKIIRLTIDPADPHRILEPETWLPGSALGTLPVGIGTELRFPNGLAVDGNRFYSTDGGSVFHVDLQVDGSPGPVTPIFFEATAHDDLSLAGESLLVTDFFFGRIFQLDLGGQLLQETAPMTFFSPSAVQLARPPMFRPDDILVTEKGLLLEQNLPIDVLTLFRRTEPD